MKEKMNPTLIVVVILFLSAFLIRTYIDREKDTLDSKRNSKDDFLYLSKRINSDNASDVIINFFPLKQELVGYIEKQNLEIGLYFQYIPTGVTIGINDHTPFVAASLLKLPVAIEAQKKIENGEFSINDQITITSRELDNDYGDLYKNSVGEKFTIDELMKQSLQSSDNTANKALFYNVTNGQPENFYNSLDIPPAVVDGVLGITAEDYTSILRSLYFSSYLSFEGSNKILSLITEIEDGHNLRADLPKDIKIAQKIGIYESITDKNKKHTYSDCGIFYFPNRNYMLCVMAKGSDKKAVSEHVKNISNMVYIYIKEADSKSIR